MLKTYHVHENPRPHERSPSFPGVDSGCRWHVQTIHRGPDWEGGCVRFGTCSRLRLWLYIAWLRMGGYRRDERKW